MTDSLSNECGKVCDSNSSLKRGTGYGSNKNQIVNSSFSYYYKINLKSASK
jgi:hypothetical protein